MPLVRTTWSSRWRAKQRARGLCSRCVRPLAPTSTWYCPEHQARATWRSKLEHEDRVERGFCRQCTRSRVTSYYCAEHQRDQNVRAAASRKQNVRAAASRKRQHRALAVEARHIAALCSFCAVEHTPPQRREALQRLLARVDELTLPEILDRTHVYDGAGTPRSAANRLLYRDLHAIGAVRRAGSWSLATSSKPP